MFGPVGSLLPYSGDPAEVGPIVGLGEGGLVSSIYTDDPQKNPKAELIREITAKELLERDLPDMPIERELLRTLENARTVRQIQVINGLKIDNLERALKGEPVGTVVKSSRAK